MELKTVQTRHVPVRYLEGGVSHFHLVRDNVRISWMHSRLVVRSWVRLLNRRRTARA